MGEKFKLDKIGQKLGAVTGGGTFLTGMGTYFEYVPAVLGAIASGTGIILSIVATYCLVTKGILERRLLRDKIAKIERTPPKRGGKKG